MPMPHLARTKQQTGHLAVGHIQQGSGCNQLHGKSANALELNITMLEIPSVHALHRRTERNMHRVMPHGQKNLFFKCHPESRMLQSPWVPAPSRTETICFCRCFVAVLILVDSRLPKPQPLGNARCFLYWCVLPEIHQRRNAIQLYSTRRWMPGS